MTAERPILFSGPMVRAILDGHKTQTRRVVKVGDTIEKRDDGTRWPYFTTWAHGDDGSPWASCPYGEPGDRLWVRETWSKDALCVYPCPPIWYRADFLAAEDPSTHREHAGHCDAHKTGRPIAECFACAGLFRWRPSIFMVRRDSRLTLRVTSVRVERLQEISELDALAEGVEPYCDETRDDGTGLPDDGRTAFAEAWDAINGDRASWASNPWVWVVEFKRAERATGVSAP